MPRQRGNNAARNGLVRCILYYSMFLGLLSVRYDFERHRVRPSRTLRVYSVAQNITMLVVMPFGLASNLAELQRSDSNFLPLFTNAASVLWRTVGLCVTLGQRWRQEARLVKLVHDLGMLHSLLDAAGRRVGSAPPAPSKLYRLVYVNVAVMLCHCLVIFVGAAVAIAADPRAVNVATAYYLCVVVNYIHLVVVQHAAFLCYFYERFRLLNALLEALLLRRHPSAEALAHISRLHAALLGHLRQFNDILQLQVLCVFGTLFVTNATTSYYFVMAIASRSKERQVDTANLLVGSVLYLLFLVVLFNYATICERLVNATHNGGLVMQPLELMPNRRLHEIFFVQLQRRRARVQICGMFNIDHRSAFLFMQQTLLYTIILVQSDYSNI